MDKYLRPLFLAGCNYSSMPTLIARFMRPTWGPSGANRTQMGPMLAPWTLLSGKLHRRFNLPVVKMRTCVSNYAPYFYIDVITYPLYTHPPLRCVCSLVYYGLSLGASNLGGDDYVSFLISGAIEFPAYVFCHLTMDRIGRRWCLSGTLLLGGLSLLLTMAVPSDPGRQSSDITVTS